MYMSKKLFDFAIGNPPYQENTENFGDRPNPIYDKFMSAAFEIADTTEVITTARFLFNAGQPSKAWNEKMLQDKNFKVLCYEADASKIFPSTEIKGGVAITIHDDNKLYGAIEIFTPFEELNHILRKVNKVKNGSLAEIVSQRGLYRFTDKFYKDFPDVRKKVGEGTGNMIVSNIFDKAPEIFEEKCENKTDYLAILGRSGGKRTYKYIKKEYVIAVPYIGKYKLFFSEANGRGQFGECLTLPEIGEPIDCSTDTFINIGLFDTHKEAEAMLKYIKSKFLRTLLGVKKATQHSPKSVWEPIPLQDFTESSDIKWNTSIKNIDKQLYKKYGLSDEEINFIETNVKEME